MSFKTHRHRPPQHPQAKPASSGAAPSGPTPAVATPAAPAAPAAATKTSWGAAAVAEAAADGTITRSEWTAVKAQLDRNPKTANDATRALVRVWADGGVGFEGDVKDGVKATLREAGYDVSDEARPKRGVDEALVASLTASNVTETDVDFENLVARAKVPSERRSIVAVFDNGTDLKHDALRGKLALDPKEVQGDGLDNDGDGRIDADDLAGGTKDVIDGDFDPRSSGDHGSHTAALAVAGSDRLQVLPYRALTTDGDIDFDKAIAAMEDALGAMNDAGQKTKVFSMSFGVSEPEGVKKMVAFMKKHPDVLFVKSAGNKGERLGPPKHTPETMLQLHAQALPNMMVIGATDADGSLARYSNYGAPHVTHAARGTQVLSASNDSTYVTKDGTSQATPTVADVASKCLVLAPELTPVELSTVLAVTSEPRDALDRKVASGGIIDARAATRLAAVLGLMRGGANPAQAAAQLGLGDEEKRAIFQALGRFHGAGR